MTEARSKSRSMAADEMIDRTTSPAAPSGRAHADSPSEPSQTGDAPIRVLAAVIRRGDRWLVCKRPAHKRHGGLWEFPGGKIEEGESLLAAARRELREELAVDVVAVGEVRFSRRDPGSRFVIEFVDVEIVGEPLALEHEELRWLVARELATMDLAPSDRAFVEAEL